MRHTYVYKVHTIAGCCTGVMSKHSTVYRECKVDVNTNTSFVGYNFMHFLEIHRYEQIKEKKKKKSVLPVQYIMSQRYGTQDIGWGQKNTCIGNRHCIKELNANIEYEKRAF